jgi:hypothetical protein
MLTAELSEDTDVSPETTSTEPESADSETELVSAPREEPSSELSSALDGSTRLARSDVTDTEFLTQEPDVLEESEEEEESFA